MKNLIPLSLVISFFVSQTIQAANPPVVGRISIGSTSSDLDAVNTELEAQSLDKFGTIPMLVAEVSYSFKGLVEFGLNYTKRESIKEETVAAATNYQADLSQDMALAVLRIPILKTDFVRADIFGGAGGANTELKIRSATQDGTLSRTRSSESWFDTPVTRYGASLAVGHKGLYFVMEAGMETNKVKSLNRTGTINNNIQSIDLSGPYGTIGILIDGVTITKI